jgi:hypothetical protein
MSDSYDFLLRCLSSTEASGNGFIASLLVRAVLSGSSYIIRDRLCGLVFSVSGYRSRGPGFDSRPYQIF